MPQNDTGVRIWFGRTVLSNKRLAEEVLIALGLIVLTILVLSAFVFTDRFPGVYDRTALPVILGVAAVIFVLGVLIIMQIVEPLVKIIRETRLIAGGDYDRKIRLDRRDELGELGGAVNVMTARIRAQLAELQELSRATERLNAEIQRRVEILAHLTAVSDKIAGKAPLEEILQIAMDRCFGAVMDYGCVILRDGGDRPFRTRYIGGRRGGELRERGLEDLEIHLGRGIPGKVLLHQEVTVLDPRTPDSEDLREFRRLFGPGSALVTPITSGKGAYGLMIIGKQEVSEAFPPVEREVSALVAKNLAVAVLNDLLSREVERSGTVDGLTGLATAAFGRRTLKKEIVEAVRGHRSCSLILLRIDGYGDYLREQGRLRAEGLLVRVAEFLKERFGTRGCPARMAEEEFAVILPRCGKREALVLGEEVGAGLRSVLAPAGLILQTAVVENPIDGATAEELLLKGHVRLTGAGGDDPRMGGRPGVSEDGRDP